MPLRRWISRSRFAREILIQARSVIDPKDRMLELRPSCEHCGGTLPPHSTEAMICSFECTFCKDCVDNLLENVCPNCGGGFTPRPVRPARDWKANNFLGTYPARTAARHRPVDLNAHRRFAEKIKPISPENR